MIEKNSSFEFDLPDSNLCRELYLNLKAAIVINNKAKDVIYCYNADSIRSVASISKLLTAMVILDNYQPDSVLKISKLDARKSARSLFRTGDKATMKSFLHAALMQSDNRSARCMARHIAGSYDAFTKLMNKKGRDIGLKNTIMYEPTGLDERNQSTAADCARLIGYVTSEYPHIAQITSLKSYSFSLVNRKKTIRLVNTNRFVFSKYKVLAGKTGYIIASDYCLATVLQNAKGEEITLVILGAPGPKTRFREARKLANYVFKKIG